MFRPQREVVLVLGKTGSGKTTLARYLARQQTRVIVLDNAGFNEYGVNAVYTFEDLRAYLIQHNSNGQGFFRVSYAPRGGEAAAMMEFSQAVNYDGAIETGKLPVNHSWIVLEEADILPDPEDMEEYDEIISRGRHHGVNILATSLYPAKLPIMLRRQATRICAFASHEPADIKWYREVFGERADEIPTLAPHYYLEWTREKTQGPLTLELEKL